MRAIAFDGFGSAPTLHLLPTPAPGPGEVRVRVRFSSLNAFDLMVANGYAKAMMEHRFPVVLGKDFAGIVDAVGPDAGGFAVGDEVFGVVSKPFLGGDGAFAEFVTVPVSFGVARVPKGLPLAEAGALGVAGVAARAIVEALALRAGETVLVSGATGGVGAFVVQLAAARGARVVATAKPGAAADFVRGLGAAATVDPQGDLAAAVRSAAPDGVNAVAHLAGDGIALAGLLVPGGRFASAMGVGPEQLSGKNVTATSIMGKPTAEILSLLAAEVSAGRLRVPVQRTYALEAVPQALADFAAGKLGKLSVSVTG